MQIPFVIAEKTDFGGGGFGGAGAGGSFTTDIAEGNADYLTDFADSSKWGNLSQNWKQELLSTGFFSGMNVFLSKINFVFVILFGESYEFSLLFVFIIILWFWFFFQFKRILKAISLFSSWVSLIISFGLAVALAQLGLYKSLSAFFVKLIFLPKSPWLGIVFFFLIIAVLIILSKFGKMIEIKTAKNKELLEKEKEKINRNVLDTYVGGLKKGFDK